MRRTLLFLVAALALGLAVLAAGCGGDEAAAPAEPPAETGAEPAQPPAEEPPAEEPPAEEPPAEEPPAEGAPVGGIYRIGVESSFNFVGGFDPVGEYLGDAWAIYTDLLLRNLVTYKHTAGAAGNEIVPDLATDLGQVSEDGLTYTFTLKDGIKFGPPLSREITSRDIAYAFERIGTESLVAQYAFYYTPIAGLTEFTEGSADTISGIETPDDKTIVFTLTEPTGDFLFRLAMPATAPVPEEVAGCFDEANLYGQYLIASGPYMIEGSDALDATSCDTLQPISGYDPNASLSLVRNPDYDPATDSPEVREALPDGFLWTVNTNVDDIFNKVKAGELEDAGWASNPPKVIKEYTEDPELQDLMKVEAGDRTWYITMNLTQPPFDDIHVRKAVNFVMDKAGLQRAWGGPTLGPIATHTMPNALLNDALVDYDPYPSEGSAGDVEAAKAEMAQSQYDTDGDGICDAPECSGVLHVTRNQEVWRNMEPVIEQSLAQIGIEVKTREFEDSYTVIQTVAKNVPISSTPGWGKDYGDPSTYAVLWDSANIIPTGNVNYSLVGLTPEQAADLKGITGTVDGIPSVDADIAACNALTGEERNTCWADFDKKIMEEVVPWVPYLDATKVVVIGPAVAQWDFDQFPTNTAYAHVAVDVSKQSG